MAAFSKACALTSRNYVSNPDVSMPNLSDELNFLVAQLGFYFGKVASKFRFPQFFLSPKEALVAKLSETGASITSWYVVEQGLIIPNSKKNLNFSIITFFLPLKNFRDYFQ